jgi:hypothetical protein
MQTKIDRNKDTRRKIQIGGLVITSKLDYLYDENEAIIFGILAKAKKDLEHNPNIKSEWLKLGIKELSIYNTLKSSAANSKSKTVDSVKEEDSTT